MAWLSDNLEFGPKGYNCGDREMQSANRRRNLALLSYLGLIAFVSGLLTVTLLGHNIGFLFPLVIIAVFLHRIYFWKEVDEMWRRAANRRPWLSRFVTTHTPRQFALRLVLTALLTVGGLIVVLAFL